MWIILITLESNPFACNDRNTVISAVFSQHSFYSLFFDDSYRSLNELQNVTSNEGHFLLVRKASIVLNLQIVNIENVGLLSFLFFHDLSVNIYLPVL